MIVYLEGSILALTSAVLDSSAPYPRPFKGRTERLVSLIEDLLFGQPVNEGCVRRCAHRNVAPHPFSSDDWLGRSIWCQRCHWRQALLDTFHFTKQHPAEHVDTCVRNREVLARAVCQRALCFPCQRVLREERVQAVCFVVIPP